MAKIRRRSIDAAKRSSWRKKSYKAPAVRRKSQISKKRRGLSANYKTLRKPQKKSSGFVFFLLILFLATLAGFLNYNNKEEEVIITESLEMKVEAKSKIISGEQIEYIIHYKNLDDVILTKMELSVQWPGGFYFDEANIIPHDLAATTWFLEDLIPQEEKEISIKGQLVGQKDDLLKAIFNLAYQPENFHSDFNSKQIIETEIKDSKIELIIETIDKTLIGEEQDFIIKVKNLTKEVQTELYLDILYPDDLEILSLEPSKDGQYWLLNLEEEEEYIITAKGIFNTGSKRKQVLVSELGTMMEDKFRPLSKVEKKISVLNPQFDINLTINGQAGNQNIDWGDILHYQLEITNNSKTNISDVEIKTLLSGPALDENSIESIGLYSNETISWSQEELEDLGDWPDGEIKIFTWEAQVVAQPLSERLIENIVKINVKGLKNWEEVNPPLLLNVGESLSFNNGLYWDLGGLRVGSGSLPPQVGGETNYLTVWSLPTVTGNFDSVIVNTILPPQVSFSEEADIQDGQLSFNEETRELTWSIDNFKEVILPTAASFIIKLEPLIEYQGQAMTLLNTITIKAQGLEEVILSSPILKTSDVLADTDQPIGIIE